MLAVTMRVPKPGLVGILVDGPQLSAQCSVSAPGFKSQFNATRPALDDDKPYFAGWCREGEGLSQKRMPRRAINAVCLKC
jgi:hypothetical protein